jgi:hypothetical protein
MRKGLNQGKKAVLSDRFLSWDRFKEKTFALNMNFTPVNKHIRTLFASSLLEENKKNGDLFKGIIRPEYSEGSNSFLSWITSVLTEVKSFRENRLLMDIPLSEGVRDDLDFLYKRYMKFLDDREMFEPSWVQAKIEDIGENYFLFFPDVIDDFKEFASDLEKSSVVHIINTVNKPLTTIEHYNSSTAELKSLLGKIGLLMDKGVRVQDIAITLPDMKGWRVPLEAEASLRSIPLDFRQGKSLSEYPGGKLFQIILGCEKSGFSISSMKQMLLNRLLPWKDREIAGRLFHFGMDHHCFRNYRLRGREIDVWENTLVKSKESELLEFYQRLKSGIKKISSGKNFTEIKSSVQMFISIFLDTSFWRPGTLREFQFCLNTLNDLEDASVKAGDLEYGTPCDIWLSAIDDRIYVKRSETTGVNIFPYRVAAGASWSWHFVPGLSQDAVSVVKSKYMFLKDNQRKLLSGLESDFTDPFLDLYNVSVENIIFSFSMDSFSGPALPPSRFVLEKAIELVEGNSGTVEDEYRTELGYWLGENSLPIRIFSVMKKGADFSVMSALKQKSIDYTKDIISNTMLQKSVTSKLINERGNLHISPSSLDQFTTCPYLFLFQRGLDVSEGDYKEVFIDHPVFGQIIHDCFDRFFKYVDGSSSEFSLSLLAEYKIEINSIVDSVFNRYAALGKDFIAPAWKYCREFTRNKLVSFIEVEAVQFPGFRLAAAEKKYTYLLKAASPSSKRSARPGKDRKIELSGRIDRVSFKGDKTAIIDYKKKNHLKKADMKPNVNGPSTFQIPFYTYLVEQSGLKVSSASYYDVTNCKYDHVYNPVAKNSWCSIDEMKILLNQLEKSVNLMDERIKKGDYSVPPDGCESCSFRRICRTKYHVR